MDTSKQAAIDYIQQEISKELQNYAGTVPSSDDVKKTLSDTLKKLEARNIICNTNTENVKVEQLWRTWSLKKKIKWFVYNKIPFLKDSSEEIRKAIDSYNELWLMTEATDELVDYLEYMEYPEHLKPFPKMIYVSSLNLKTNASINFIPLEITIGDKK